MSGVNSASDSGIEAFVLQPDDVRPAELVVLAFMAEMHGEVSLLTAVSAIQQRHVVSPSTRFAAAALGRREPRNLTSAEVRALLCSDGVDARRYPETATDPATFEEVVRAWVILAGRAKLASGSLPSRASDDYESERLIRDNASTPPSKVWIGGF